MPAHKYGYARVSALGQDTELQEKALEEAGCHLIWVEKASASTRRRPELAKLLEFLREGDTLVITRIDRLARSMKDLQDIVFDLEQRGVALQATMQPSVDTSDAAGKAFLDMLGTFAEFETRLRRERQKDGIDKAKAAGKYKGRSPLSKQTRATVIRMRRDGVRPIDIARELGVSRTSVYTILKGVGLVNKRKPKED